jgi:hypothetical protein
MVMTFMFLVKWKIEARAVDSFYGAIPKVHAGYRKRGEILLKVFGNYRPFSD